MLVHRHLIYIFGDNYTSTIEIEDVIFSTFAGISQLNLAFFTDCVLSIYMPRFSKRLLHLC